MLYNQVLDYFEQYNQDVQFYRLEEFLPLSFLNSPSIPIQTLIQLNQLVLSLDEFVHKNSIDSEKVEQLLTQNYKGVTKLNFLLITY